MSGTSEKMKSRDFKMRDSIFFSLLLLNERRKARISMQRELMSLGFRRLRIRKEVWQRSKERESRFSERCSRPERIWIRKERREM